MSYAIAPITRVLHYPDSTSERRQQPQAAARIPTNDEVMAAMRDGLTYMADNDHPERRVSTHAIRRYLLDVKKYPEAVVNTAIRQISLMR